MLARFSSVLVEAGGHGGAHRQMGKVLSSGVFEPLLADSGRSVENVATSRPNPETKAPRPCRSVEEERQASFGAPAFATVSGAPRLRRQVSLPCRRGPGFCGRKAGVRNGSALRLSSEGADLRAPGFVSWRNRHHTASISSSRLVNDLFGDPVGACIQPGSSYLHSVADGVETEVDVALM